MEAIFAKERSSKTSDTDTVDPVRQNFSDVHGTTSFLWTPQERHLADHENSLRMKNRRFLSYCSEEGRPEYIAISTVRKKTAAKSESNQRSYYYRRSYYGNGSNSGSASSSNREPNDFYHCAVMPVEPFLTLMQHPLKLADMLEQKGNDILQEWLSKNEGVRPEDRQVAEKGWPVVEQSFVQGRVRYFTEYEMQIQTWLYTEKAKKVAIPERIQLRDCKFLFKARTTFDANKVVDKARLVNGFVYDQYAYKIPLLHWLSFLRSPACQHFLVRLHANRNKYLFPERALNATTLDTEEDSDTAAAANEEAERRLWKHPLPSPQQQQLAVTGQKTGKKGPSAVTAAAALAAGKDPHALALKRKVGPAAAAASLVASTEGDQDPVGAGLDNSAAEGSGEKKRRKKGEKKQLALPLAAAAAPPGPNSSTAATEDYYHH